MTLAVTNQASGASETIIANIAASSQIGMWAAAGITPAVSGSNQPTSAIDMTASTTIVLTGQKATGSETLTLLGYLLEVIRA